MSTLDLKAYEIFKSKLGEKEAEIVIEYFESKTESKYQEKKDIFLTKDDKVDMIKWMVGLWLTQMAAILGIYLTK
jgi:hypothetical protein